MLSLILASRLAICLGSILRQLVSAVDLSGDIVFLDAGKELAGCTVVTGSALACSVVDTAATLEVGTLLVVRNWSRCVCSS